MKKTLTIILALLVIVLAGMLYISYKKEPVEELLPPEELSFNRVNYICKGDKTIVADYFEGEETEVEEGVMPIPSGGVRITLSDGRVIELGQTISASGIRYADEDESIVFWSKGEGAFLMEEDEETYSGCVAVAADPGDLPNVYFNEEAGFVVRYPEGYVLSAIEEKDNLSGIKFVVPATLTEGTNLSADTGVAIEIISESPYEALECKVDLFMDEELEVEEKTINEDHSYASLGYQVADDFYLEEFWVNPFGLPCMAVHYTIHATVIEEGVEDTVVETDYDYLINQFDRIRESLTSSPL